MTTGTTEKTAPKKMFKNIEQNENVPRGYVEIIQIIIYEKTGTTKNDADREVDTYTPLGIFFCQDKEDELKITTKYSKNKMEVFTIQTLKSIAEKYIDNPDNMKEFEVA